MEVPEEAMKYSVYDYTRRAYDYYEAPGPGGTHAGSPTGVRPERPLGASPERASWKLPIGAHKVGSGETPQGRIASMGAVELGADPIRWGIYAAIAYLGWRILR
jgi:hypothetical protein